MAVIKCVFCNCADILSDSGFSSGGSSKEILFDHFDQYESKHINFVVTISF